MNGEICKSRRRVAALLAGGDGGENPTHLRAVDSCLGSKVKVTAGRGRQLSQTAEMQLHGDPAAKNLAEVSVS